MSANNPPTLLEIMRTCAEYVCGATVDQHNEWVREAEDDDRMSDQKYLTVFQAYRNALQAIAVDVAVGTPPMPSVRGVPIPNGFDIDAQCDENGG